MNESIHKEQHKRAFRHWRRALIKVRVIIAMKNIQGFPIHDLDNLPRLFISEDPEADSSQIKGNSFDLSRRFVNGVSIVSWIDYGSAKNFDDMDMDQYARVEAFFRYVERGNANDLVNIQKLLDSDPKKYTRTPEDPERLMNSLNKQNESAIHVASRNNLCNVIDLLLKNSANPYQTVRTNFGNGESALDVASRWKSVDALKFLLKNVSWSEAQLRRAKKLAPNSEISEMIGEGLGKKKGVFSCFGI